MNEFVEKTYYQKKQEVTLKRAKDYYVKMIKKD